MKLEPSDRWGREASYMVAILLDEVARDRVSWSFRTKAIDAIWRIRFDEKQHIKESEHLHGGGAAGSGCDV